MELGHEVEQLALVADILGNALTSHEFSHTDFVTVILHYYRADAKTVTKIYLILSSMLLVSVENDEIHAPHWCATDSLRLTIKVVLVLKLRGRGTLLSDVSKMTSLTDSK